MSHPSPSSASLDSLPVGARVKITDILGGRILHRRLLSLGLRIGSEIEVLHHRGRGVVVATQGNRVALGSGIAEKLLTDPLPSCTDG